MMLEINSLYFIVLIWYLSPAFAPKAKNQTSTDVFFMPEIQYPQGFPRFFTQPKST